MSFYLTYARRSHLPRAIGASIATSSQQQVLGSVLSCSRYDRDSFRQLSTNHQPPRRPRRRQRPKFEKHKIEASPQKFGLSEPYAFDDDYLEKTSLSPWVPVPDSVARKLMQQANAGPDDIHIDLGCGDGRVNFHAIDYGVKQSTGIDIDEGILEKAKERLLKRHPQPNVLFLAADLLDERHVVWNHISEATIITMFFVADALQKIKPILEEKLAGKECTIITVGYEMTGWNHTLMETTLGTTVYVYKWGSVEDEDGLSFFGQDDMGVGDIGDLQPKMAFDPLGSPSSKRSEAMDVPLIHPSEMIDWDDLDDGDDDDDEETKSNQELPDTSNLK